MKWRFPLYAKIALWLLLNLAGISVAFGILLKTQLPFSIGQFLTDQVDRRLQAVSDLIGSELRMLPQSGWSGLLDRYSRAYHVQFVLFGSDGIQLAGDRLELPEKVRAQFGLPPTGIFGRGRGGGRGGMGGGGGGGPWWNRPADTPGDGAPRRAIAHRRFFLRTEQPTRYWAGVPVPMPAGEPGRGGPMVLIAVSDTLRGGGLLVDYVPWLGVAAAVLGVSILIWLPLVRGITKSLSQMSRTTAQIAEGHFDARVETNRADELGRLGESINQMAARLADLVGGQRRFLGDIAHELCSPLARIQMSLGVLEQRIPDAQQDSLRDLREEVEEMSGLVNELLSFTRATLGSKAVKLQATRLLDVANRAVQRETGAGDRVVLEVPPDLAALADPDLLTRALANLVRNAVRYAGPAGPVTLQAASARDRVILTVSDQGPGIDPADLTRIFEPFYRPDAVRQRETGGVGLGLAIVKTCVEACQGSVTAYNRQPTGLTVEIQLRQVP